LCTRLDFGIATIRTMNLCKPYDLPWRFIEIIMIKNTQQDQRRRPVKISGGTVAAWIE